MKKLMALLLVACLGFTVFACSAPQEAEEGAGEPSEAAIPAENEVALSMTYPGALGEMEFVVAGTWEKIEGEDQLTFNTGFSTIIIGVSDESDPVALVERILIGASVPVGDLAFNDDRQDVEANGISGIKEGITVGGMEGEVFTWSAGSKTYALVALYPDRTQQSAGFEATDTLFSSMLFTGEGEKPQPDEGQVMDEPAQEEAQEGNQPSAAG